MLGPCPSSHLHPIPYDDGERPDGQVLVSREDEDRRAVWAVADDGEPGDRHVCRNLSVQSAHRREAH